jgi:uncharacterized protein (DUF849 family)
MPATDPTRQPVIIEAAINGQTQKQANPHVPHSSEEIAQDALACLEAGAAIVHTHIHDILVAPERAGELYLEHFLPVLEKRPDALLYPTVGFGATVELRMAHSPSASGRRSSCAWRTSRSWSRRADCAWGSSTPAR